METFDYFEKGKLAGPSGIKNFGDLPWNKHSKFPGVEIKNIITGAETNGTFSYCLVRISPGCSIGSHIHPNQTETHEVICGSGTGINNGTEISYQSGVISIIDANVSHKVIASADGLCLFAKFIPAL